MVFVESANFTRDLRSYMSDDDYVGVQSRLVANPRAGSVMPGCGGLRKLRAADPRRGKGRRGGLRIVYLHVPAIDRVYLLDLYDKDEADDLTAQQRRQLASMASRLRASGLERAPRS